MQLSANIAKFAAIFVWFFWLCSNVQTVLGSARTLKERYCFIKMNLDFNFTVSSWFLGNVHVKPYFNTHFPAPAGQIKPYL